MVRDLRRLCVATVLAGVLTVSPCGAEGARPTRALEAPQRFGLFDDDEWTRTARALEALAEEGVDFVSLDEVRSDLNRKARPIGHRVRLYRDAGKRRRRSYRVDGGFLWNAEDQTTRNWYPQGISGSGDAHASGTLATRRWVLVSWYARKTPEKGVRISLVDVSQPKKTRYRHVLLAEPVLRDGQADFEPVVTHAGGIMLYGNLLYVADTKWGLLVFDTSRMFRAVADPYKSHVGMVRGEAHAFDYRYVLPMVGRYRQFDPLEMRFSFVGLDRTRVPHGLWAGEYQERSGEGFAVRFPLDSESHRLKINEHGHVLSAKSLRLNRLKTQGFVVAHGHFLFNHSYASDPHRFHVQSSAGYSSKRAPYGLEDLHYDASLHRLWMLTEHPKSRAVFYLNDDSWDDDHAEK